MHTLEAGDLVRLRESEYDMLIICVNSDNGFPAASCVWEAAGKIYEQDFPVEALTIVRRERRRVLRNGELGIPKRAA